MRLRAVIALAGAVFLYGATPVTNSCPACIEAVPPAVTIPSVQGAAAVVPVRDDGAYALVHQYGDVSLMAADGSRMWHRPATSFRPEWDATGSNDVPVVHTGYDAFDPFSRVSDRAYAFGKLGGESGDHLAIAQDIRLELGRRGSHVTVLEPITGRTMWSASYPGVVTQLLIEDGLLLVGHETGASEAMPGTWHNGPRWGKAGTRTSLTAMTFSTSGDGQLVAEPSWSYTPGPEWARLLAVEPAGSGAVALGWTATEPDGGAEDRGTVALLDARTGAPQWETSIDGYPRLLRHDEMQDEIVVVEQADPSVDWSYTLTGFHVHNGAPSGPAITRRDAVPFALAVDDIDGTGGSEWLTTHATAGSSPSAAGVQVTDATVTAVHAADRSTLWTASSSDTVVSPPGWPLAPHPRALAVRHVDDTSVVLVGTYLDGTEPLPQERRYSGESVLRAFAGNTGEQLWERSGDVLTPLSVASYEVDGKAAVLTTTGKLVVHAYGVADGAVLVRQPLLGTVTAVAPTDVNHDGVTDLVVGGLSEAVFALDGRTLGNNPSILWETSVAGEVHEIHDVSLPDGRQHLVVVAATASVVDGNSAYPVPTSSAIDVLATETGERQVRIPTMPDYAWTAEVATVTSDGTPAIIVPTSSVTAYSASTGRQLWRFTPVPADAPRPLVSPAYFSNVAVTDDGEVAAQYFVNAAVRVPSQRLSPTNGNPNNHTRVLLDGATGEPKWQAPVVSPGAADLWRSVTTGVTTAAGSPGVAFTHAVGQQPSFTTQVDVHDLRDGSVSYSGALSRGGHMGTLALSTRELISFNRFNQIASITPNGPIERDLNWPAGEDLAEAHSRRFGDVLVTSSAGHGWIGIHRAHADGQTYARVGDWVGGVTGGQLLAHDLDGDGSDEILHFAYDASARMAVTNQNGLFSIGTGRDGFNDRGVDVYRLDTVAQLIETALDLHVTGHGRTVIATASLTESENGAPIEGARIVFSINGTLVDEAATNDTGHAHIELRRHEFKGRDILRVEFIGDERYAPAATERSARE